MDLKQEIQLGLGNCLRSLKVLRTTTSPKLLPPTIHLLATQLKTIKEVTATS